MTGSGWPHRPTFANAFLWNQRKTAGLDERVKALRTLHELLRAPHFGFNGQNIDAGIASSAEAIAGEWGGCLKGAGSAQLLQQANLSPDAGTSRDTSTWF